MVQQLDGEWTLLGENGGSNISTGLPCSVYDCLIRAGKMPDPYFGENQYAARQLSDGNYVFEHIFAADSGILDCEKVCLRFNGIDTLSEITLNGRTVGTTENMHRTYEYDVTDILTEKNVLRVKLLSPLARISEMQRREPVWGVDSTADGFPHIRKAHYMFGWDWGPVLPDLGIWRSAELVGINGGRIESVYVKQEHRSGSVKVIFDTRLSDITSEKLRLDISVTSPEGEETLISLPADKEAIAPECVITSPMLWNVRGYGKQNLYMVRVMLFDGDEPVDIKEFNVGLRTVEVCREADKDGSDGEEFCFRVNGVKIFAMGANYVPEDNILPRRSAERTGKLLKSCAAANYNMIRVWGGGFYPDDSFYDACDRLGLLVWQDFAFACAVYNADASFCANVKQEVIDNVKRLRNHPSLGMWCGNNEIESAILYWGIPVTEEQKQGYLRIFEKLIPSILRHYDPQTFYWCSSPSSGGNFDEPSNENKGDSHYWAVWHGFKPFDDFRKHEFRFCSEYGFESIPCMKTVRAFASPKDMNLCSPVMQAHQKCGEGNEKLLYYLAQMSRYPYSFENLVYVTQLVQADAVRLCAEHMRRHRGKCMGSLYWQVNDSNPVISWSSIDYFGRWKALHYYAKKFYAPVLCSVDDSNKERLVINVSNERLKELVGTVKWRVRRNDTTIISQGAADVTVPPLTAANVLTLTPEYTKLTPDMYRDHYIEYAVLESGATISSGTLLLTVPKMFEFLDPEITVSVDKMGDMYRFDFESKGFAKGVYLDFDEYDCIFSDNWFDLHGKTYSVLAGKGMFPQGILPKELEEKLKIKSYYDIIE